MMAAKPGFALVRRESARPLTWRDATTKSRHDQLLGSAHPPSFSSDCAPDQQRCGRGSGPKVLGPKSLLHQEILTQRVATRRLGLMGPSDLGGRCSQRDRAAAIRPLIWWGMIWMN